MGPFTLPVPDWRLGPPQRKRKHEAREQTGAQPIGPPSPSPDERSNRSSSHLPSDSINPLSHSPATLRQLAVAGLSPGDELPSKLYPYFPHKPLPRDAASTGSRRRSRSRSRGRINTPGSGDPERRQMSAASSGSEADVDTDATEPHRRRLSRQSPHQQQEGDEMTEKVHSARLKHLNTMMAIMHRCLHESDIERAKRAFGLIIRMREVDIRQGNMWAIGTEILMRDGEKEAARGSQDHDTTSVGQGRDATQSEASGATHRWGAAANIDTVKAYLQNLIQHHPYDPHLPQVTGAVDFWPALFSIEIYNIDAESKAALARLDQEFDQSSLLLDEDDDEYEDDDGYERDGSRLAPEEYADNNNDDDDDDGGASRHHRRSRRALRWAGRDEIRHETQGVALQVVARMDQLMENAPYAAHPELLRLRGMLSLFVGDLYLSSSFMARDRGRLIRTAVGGAGGSASGTTPQDREALRRRDAEVSKARVYFAKLLEKGGELEPWLLEVMEEGQEDDEDSSFLSGYG
ncbi:hypothetical protein BX600DRAFT_491700 [Xylariales sp. PMI_506]|nr:hypothetical protein BX600DRAFT_491700 [Xylariales sp. PMI_506]